MSSKQSKHSSSTAATANTTDSMSSKQDINAVPEQKQTKSRAKTTSSIASTAPQSSNNIADMMSNMSSKVSSNTSANTSQPKTKTQKNTGGFDMQSGQPAQNMEVKTHTQVTQVQQTQQATQATQQAIQQTSQGVRFVYLMHRKGAKYGDKGITMKLGASNNVISEREKFEEGNDNDLKCAVVIECLNMDAKRIEATIAETLTPHKQNERGWYCITKETLDNIMSRFIDGKNYLETTEKRGKLTQKELKEFGFK